MTHFFTNLYKEINEKELERKSKVNDSVNLIIGVVSGFIATIFYFLVSYDFKGDNVLNFVFLVAISITVILILYCVFFMVKASTKLFAGYEYKDLPYVSDLDSHYQELERYYKENEEYFEGGKANDNFAKDKFELYLLNTYREITDHNARINDKKYELIFNSKKFLIAALLGMIVSTSLFAVNFFIKQKENSVTEVVDSTHEIKLINDKLDSIIISIEDFKKINNEQEDSTATPAAAASKKN